MSREREYAARLFLAWLNERFSHEYSPTDLESPVWHAEDAGSDPVSMQVSELFEAPEAWQQRRAELEQRLDESRPGSYMLWLPPGAELPDGEPDESEWVRLMVLSASKLASGRSGEARIPAKLAIGKVRDDGGYASVVGGLGRHWTNISGRLQGSFYLDSRGLNRFTRNEEEREQLYEHIAMLSQGLQTGELAEFEHEDAWTLQRLARGPAGAGMEDGWAITGCPPGFNPADGGATRRLLRRRITDATTDIAGAPGLKALVLIGAYDYMEFENAGPSLRGFDPALASAFDVIALVTDGEVKPLRLSRSLS